MGSTSADSQKADQVVQREEETLQQKKARLFKWSHF